MKITKFKIKSIEDAIKELNLPIKGIARGGELLFLVWTRDPSLEEFSKLKDICKNFRFEIDTINESDITFLKRILHKEEVIEEVIK